MKKLILIIFVLTFFAIARVSYAEEVTVGGQIDNFGANSAGSKVEFRDSTSQEIVAEREIDPMGNYILVVPEGNYDVLIIPPTGSGIDKIEKSNITLTNDEVINFSLPKDEKTQVQNSGFSDKKLIIGFVILVIIAAATYFWKKR